PEDPEEPEEPDPYSLGKQVIHPSGSEISHTKPETSTSLPATSDNRLIGSPFSHPKVASPDPSPLEIIPLLDPISELDVEDPDESSSENTVEPKPYPMAASTTPTTKTLAAFRIV